MAVLAYSLGKREINQYFTIKNAKVISLVAVLVLLVFHTAQRYYGGKCWVVGGPPRTTTTTTSSTDIK